MSFVEKEEYYEFKEEMRKAISDLEKTTTEKIHKVELMNETVLGLLQAMDIKLDGTAKGQDEQVKSQRTMEKRMDGKLDNINESIEKVNESVHSHSVSIAVLQENRMAKPVFEIDSNKVDEKKLNIITEYKKWWIGGIISFATAVGVALLNNAEAILTVFGVGK